MKNSKILMTATFVVLAMFTVGLTSTVQAKTSLKEDKKNLVNAPVYLTLDQAMQNYWIAKIMSEDLTNDFLKGKKKLQHYTARIIFLNTVYYITSTYEEWVHYFRTHGTNTDPVFILPIYHE